MEAPGPAHRGPGNGPRGDASDQSVPAAPQPGGAETADPVGEGFPDVYGTAPAHRLYMIQ